MRIAARRRQLLVVLLAAASGAPTLAAQTTLSHLDDAAPVPSGMLRLRVDNAWTRYDQRFTADGLAPLNAELSAYPLGVAQLPLLASLETGLRTLTGNANTRISLGRLQVGGDARVVTTPLTLDFGLTSRLTIGVVVPIVQTRRVAVAHVNERKLSPERANMGFVSAGSRLAAAQNNAAVAAAFQRAADSLSARIARCQQNPGGTGCAAINANASDAAAARAQAAAFAGAVQALGTDSARAILAPRAGSQVAIDVEQQRLALNQRLQQYLGAGYGAATGVFIAPYDFSYADLQGRNSTGTTGLLASTLGGGLDSIHTTERIGLGDVAVRAQMLVLDNFQHDTLPLQRFQSRLAVGGLVRFATSVPDSGRTLTDIGTGDGAGFELRSVMDVIVGHFGSTIAARYAKSFARTVSAPLYGDPEAAFPYPVIGPRQRTAGDVFGLDLTPRWLLDESFSVDALYGLERIGASTYDTPPNVPVALCPGCTLPDVATTSGTTRTAQRIGLGVRYSTLDAYVRRRAPYPVEVSFAHLTTVSGDPGVPKLSREQIRVSIYYRLR